MRTLLQRLTERSFVYQTGNVSHLNEVLATIGGRYNDDCFRTLSFFFFFLLKTEIMTKEKRVAVIPDAAHFFFSIKLLSGFAGTDSMALSVGKNHSVS